MNRICLGMAVLFAAACTPKTLYRMGTYGYELNFLQDNGVETVELCSTDGCARVLTVPSWQGRVVTSAAEGLEGASFGWINHKFIAEGKLNPQFNNWGGEERFWLGPEGGANSWFFAPGAEQTFPNWKVPSPFDTDAFEFTRPDSSSVCFSRDVVLDNACGIRFEIGMRRLVHLLGRHDIEGITGALPEDVSAVAYSSENTVCNNGTAAWDECSGMPSVWMLGMINPSETTTVFIPYNPQGDGPVVKDDYFGKIPADRLSIRDGFILFKIDGRLRTKLGLSATRSLGLVGAYDPEQGLLTILKTAVPAPGSRYVNSQWGEQTDAFGGDALNSYNDGPTEDGTVMGPFYEIETSSEAAALAPGESLTHCQTTLHLQGSPASLRQIIACVFGTCPFDE